MGFLLIGMNHKKQGQVKKRYHAELCLVYY
ncbi:hypothetical protein COMA1_90060 [Candidatus Nitrospira nitrosa]|uniref:Uncharacterized protein n=1 Tax=Candidatus Nitrospira nitrosa TaxID=1742972 RepID=A0A0S4LT52_9BACT|nr:hypothetical protein COMA1_90060 [Candidatus Nitrospira nitrosa]